LIGSEKTSEKATESECNRMSRYINVHIQLDKKCIGFRKKKLKGHIITILIGLNLDIKGWGFFFKKNSSLNESVECVVMKVS